MLTSLWEPYIAQYLDLRFFEPFKIQNSKGDQKMSEKVYVLNVYNTMTGQYELSK